MDIARGRFIFHGHACAFSGRLYRPEDIVIPSPASAVLSVTGGYAEASGARQRFSPYLTVGRSSASAEGRFTHRAQALAMTHGRVPEDALPTSTICAVEINDIAADSKRLQVKQLTARLTGVNPKRTTESPIRLSKQTAIRGVSIDGYELRVAIDAARFDREDTFDAIARAGARKPGVIFERHERLIHTTIVRELKWAGKAHPTAKIEGHCLYVPGFGRVFFGEMFIERSSRRLTLMRLHLGSPIGLRVGFGDVGTNGSWYPPTT